MVEAPSASFDNPLSPGDGETLDAICGGAVRILQRERGYRFTLDPVLLSHFAAEAVVRGPVIDLGTGTGIIPLILARKFGHANLTALELQPSLYELAARNVRLNRCEHRISLALGDLRRARHLFRRATFAHVIANPPYFVAGRANPDREKALARHCVTCTLDDLARASAWLLNDGGGLHVIFAANRLTELFAALRRERLEPRRLRLVHTRLHRPARLALLTAVKRGGPDLTVVPPLVLHPDDGPGFTPEVRLMVESAGPAAGHVGTPRGPSPTAL